MVVMMKGDLDLEVETPLVEIRKGPWTEEEDMQLMCFVGLFGERRWDFIAKVSGLRRTGKSCRLRWVNYLHPGLKRGRMTPQEERLVLELHARWGNRWSRIARKLPGRTDNEIKNYWRTHMRKKAQERKSHEDAITTTSIITSSSSSSLCSTIQTPTLEAATTTTNTTTKTREGNNNEVDEVKGYPMEKIWDDIASSEINHDYSNYHINGENITICCCPPSNPLISSSPIWDYCSNGTPIWKMDEEEELKMLMSTDGFHGFVSNYHHGKESNKKCI